MLSLKQFGLGSVGQGVVQIIRNHPRITAKFDVLVRDASKSRDVETGDDLKITDDLSKALEWREGDSDVVIELIGGADGLAWSICQQALRQQRRLVTANKAMIAKHLPEIEELLKENPLASIRYEASVAGGIPVLRSIADFHASNGDKIERVEGILNGSCNYLLTLMERDPYATQTQAVINSMMTMGILEENYVLDLDGSDAESKLIILTRVAFGRIVSQNDIFKLGVLRIIKADLDFAQTRGCRVRLVASAAISNGCLALNVCPHFVPSESAYGQTEWSDNIVKVNSEYLPEIALKGPGAGRLPTASSVVSDIQDILRSAERPSFPTLTTSPNPIDTWTRKSLWVLRGHDDTAVGQYTYKEAQQLSFQEVSEYLAKHSDNYAFLCGPAVTS